VARLVYQDMTGTQRRQVLGRRVTIGRHPGQDIQLLDRVVSKEHAVITAQNDQFILTDIGSRNGTFVNGERIKGPIKLKDKDQFTCGATVFTFESRDAGDSLVERVTVHGPMDSAVFTRVSGRLEIVFLPEEQITSIETLRTDYEKLRIANELNQSLSTEFDLDKLCARILDRAFAIFPCDRGVILIKDQESSDLNPRAARLRNEDVDQPDIRISETILREVMEHHQAILSSDATMDSRFSGSHSIILEGIRSTMTVPLLYQDRLLGIIHLDSKIATGAFSEKDLHLLNGFARQASNSIEHTHLVLRMRQEALNREKLGRLLSPQIVEQVLEGRLDIRKGGSVLHGTVLFADIRGFTTMAEQIAPMDAVAMLNEYFEIMVEIIFKYGGTLDKFVGDEIMAIWGAPFSQPDDSVRAVTTAVEMQRALAEFNDTRRGEGLEPIQIGIGLNTGEMVAGYMGSSRSMSYTVVGDTVNTGHRLCALAGPGEVIVAGSTVEELRGVFRVEAMPPTRIKGKAQAVAMFRVLGEVTPAL
jgi:adenylate cyclase